MLAPKIKQSVIDHYSELFLKHGSSPGATQASAEGQLIRFEQLSKVADLSGKKVLDLGCGIADFYPFLQKQVGNVEYTGIDIVPAMIDYARQKYSTAKFQCRDIIEQPLDEEYDFVFISTVFNNAILAGTGFLESMLQAAFERARLALSFNFTSTRVNYVDDSMAYYDPVEVLEFCISNLM